MHLMLNEILEQQRNQIWGFVWRQTACLSVGNVVYESVWLIHTREVFRVTVSYSMFSVLGAPVSSTSKTWVRFMLLPSPSTTALWMQTWS